MDVLDGPGDGGFDVPGFLRAAHAGGLAAPYYGVEIIGEAYRRQPLDVMARTSFEATMRQVDLIRADLTGGRS